MWWHEPAARREWGVSARHYVVQQALQQQVRPMKEVPGLVAPE
jgi:hypothetical protein